MSGVDPRVRWFHSRRFCLRDGDEPELARASGDSGFVAHLTACTHGATGWDWSFRLVKPGHGWSFVNDGKLTLFIDEPGQYVPADAKTGELIAVRLPRARENLVPHRFTLYGGQGGVVVGHGFAKLFLPVTYEASAALVETFSSRLADQLRFSLFVSNSALDFGRTDAAVLDVGAQDEAGVERVLEAFLRTHPTAFAPRGQPFSTEQTRLGFPRAIGLSRADVADGFGWRRSHEAVQSGKEAS